MQRDMASSSDFPAKVKEEMDDDFDDKDGHSHIFTVQFGKKGEEYTILCESPCTVLEAIKSNETAREMITCADENIVIQQGTGDNECTIATHFPCTLIKKNESLLILQKKEIIERKTQREYLQIYPQNEYVVFYIDKDFGLNTKKKQLFRSNVLKNFKYVCVYGVKWTTVKEALERDGRFVDDLGNFHLKNIEDEKRTDSTVKVMVLHKKKFKICMEKMKKGDGKLQKTPAAKGDGKLQKTPAAKGDGKLHENPGAIKPKVGDLAVAQQKAVSVISAVKMAENYDIEEVCNILRKQFPKLREQLEKRFGQRSYQKLLELKKENFGKIQQSFSEVYRVRELLKLSKSVCKIVVYKVCQGTGFVLFDDLIITNAHLFDQVTQTDHVEVYALFDYEQPEPKTDFCIFACEKKMIDIDKELDYAILKLSPEGKRSNPNNQKQIVIPPGLLKKFAPVPVKGEACIIGHPRGEVKQMDPTCIIEEENRISAINKHLEQYYDNSFIIQSVVQDLKNQGIENILQGGSQADKTVTYNTFMYHGSSGSPVFDRSCQVFGLHTSGYTYEFPEKYNQHVIETAKPLLSIFKKFVSNLREKNDETLLKRILKEVKGNEYLQAVLDDPHTPDPADETEPMDTSTQIIRPEIPLQNKHV